MTSEVNRKRKSSGYVATGWDRSTRLVSSGLLVSFELTILCTVLVGAVDHWTWTIWTADSGPLLWLDLGTAGPSVICLFPILGANFSTQLLPFISPDPAALPGRVPS